MKTRRILIDAALAAALISVGFLLFSPFERQTPLPLRLLRPLLYIGVTALLSWRFGSKWARTFAIGWLTLAAAFHGWWTWSHGINFWKPEPRDRYYQLRGWPPPPADSGQAR